MKTRQRLTNILFSLSLLFIMCGCFFTGVEHTGKITDKEVQRIINDIEQRQPSTTIRVAPDSLPLWRVGKQFFATDNQLKLLFDRSNEYDLDTIDFEGRYLTYEGFDTIMSISGQQTVNINLSDGRNRFVYRTSKTLDSFKRDFSIPLLVDVDMVNSVREQLADREVYVKTSIWYSVADNNNINGRQYIPVRITDVKPGNKVLPLKVFFETIEPSPQQAFVWISSPDAPMHNRDFDSVFSLVNPRNNYPGITDSRWNLIINSQLEEGMTKEECRLSLGNPKRISSVPDQQGMREYWYYDGGAYLYFVDGLLKTFRK